METITNWADVTMQAFAKMGEQLSSGLLNLLGAIIILILGWLITKIIILILRRLLKVTKIDKLSEKMNEANLFGEAKITFKISYVILEFVRWIMYLIFFIVAADIMNWTAISNQISRLFEYLPNLFIAIALFIIGLYIANFIRRALKGLFESLNIQGPKTISSIVFYIIIILFTITALNQADIDTSIISNNLIIIIGGFVLTLVIAFGIGSIEVIQKLLLTYYVRKNYSIGDHIKMGEVSGEIISIDSISITIQTKTEKMVLPVKEVANSNIEILKH